MNKILCLLALCALWNGYSLVAVEGQEWAADIYIDEEAKGYDEYEGSAVYDDASGVGPNGDMDTEYEDSAEASGNIAQLSDCELLLQRVQKQNLLGAYEPRCTATGEYEAMQCSGSTGECWCVNYDGETVPGTRAKSPWSPECKEVDRTRKYPKPTIKDKDITGTGTDTTDSEGVSDDDIIDREGNGKMDFSPDPDVGIGTVDTDDDDDDDGAGGESVGEKLHDRKGLLGQPLILAALIAIAVVCLLCAVLLVMFIVYRMRKKDEGSYALDEPKRSPSHPYQRAPTREYFA